MSRNTAFVVDLQMINRDALGATCDMAFNSSEDTSLPAGTVRASQQMPSARNENRQRGVSSPSRPQSHIASARLGSPRITRSDRHVLIEDESAGTHFESSSRSMLASAQPISPISANTGRDSISTQRPINMTRHSTVTTSPSSTRSPRQGTFLVSPTPYSRIDIETSRNQQIVDDISAGYFDTENTPRTNHSLTSMTEDHHTKNRKKRATFNRDISDLRKPSGARCLKDHLLNAGFRQGKHSDVIVHAFGQQYRLHKLLLDRVPFFSAAFSPAWTVEATHELTLTPEDIDQNITRNSFELALKRIYGTISTLEVEEQEAIGLFATASWLDMPDLLKTSVENILRQMRPSNLHVIFKLVTTNFYGKAGDRLLTSAKALLCRDGWEMRTAYWDSIPAGVICDVVRQDSFYIPGEYDRWSLAVRLLNRRLRHLAIEIGLLTPTGSCLQRRPRGMFRGAIRPCDTSIEPDKEGEELKSWYSLYSLPEIRPILKLLDSGIHYVHLTFELLQLLKGTRDCLGVPVLPRKVIDDALWMSMEIRQRIQNANEDELELGLSYSDENDDEVDETYHSIAKHTNEDSNSVDSGDDEAAILQKYYLPTSDLSYVVGGHSALPDWKHATQRSSVTAETTETTDNLRNIPEYNQSTVHDLPTQPCSRYTTIPPFRFCAEFPNAKALKQRKKIYSRTVWYAGSSFNLYVQRISTGKQSQLGVYLHRTKDEQESHEQHNTFLTARERETKLQHLRDHIVDHAAAALQRTSTHELKISSKSTLPIRESGAASSSNTTTHTLPDDFISMSDSDSNSDDGAYDLRTPPPPTTKTPTLPPYTDTRPIIKTYFKIYSPSRSGRLLLVYESSPDDFEFGKSWGWRSSHMVVDDAPDEEELGGGMTEEELMTGRDGKLRYMVAIGLV